VAKQEKYTRFSLLQRLEHIILIGSFTTLALTGLPQKYAGTPLGEGFIKALGGIETIRTIHHAAATLFVLQSIYHLVVLGYKIFVQHTELGMLPGVRDLTDAIGVIRYNLGLSKARPKMPRYAFDEKAEYWAMLWGTVMMALTGFMLWNPIFFTRTLPGELIPAAKAAHGGEALLAVLAILVWHFYHVHLKLFNTSMWTGKLSEHAMREEHGSELERIQSGQVRPLPAPEVARTRSRVYLPIASVLAIVLVFGFYSLTYARRTAITTIPTPSTKVPVFVPLTPTPLPPTVAKPTAAPGSAAAKPAGGAAKPLPHPIAGQEQCDSCHGPKGIKPYPADHAGRANDSCTACHPAQGSSSPAGTAAPAAAKSAATIPHPVAGREDCLMCHKADGGLKPVPASHAGRANNTCQTCHQPAAGITGTPAAAPAVRATGTAATPVANATAAASGVAKAVPHPLAGLEQCDSCHGPAGIKPMPANHAGRSNESCVTCHQIPGAAGQATPAGAAAGTPSAAAGTPAAKPAAPAPAAVAAKSIPHPTAGLEDCVSCHGPGQIKPMPTDHNGRKSDSCVACHKPS
jgi:cytochrome b subunit of formate dehydrogenase